MKKAAFYLIMALFSTALVAVEASKLRIDCTDEDTMQKTIMNIMMNLDDSMQKQFAAALATIGVAGMQNPDLTEPARIKNMLDGKNADEVIALAFNKGVPIPKNYEEIREFELSAVSKSEAEKIHGGKIDDNPAIPAEKAPKKSEPSFAPSLVPSQNL